MNSRSILAVLLLAFSFGCNSNDDDNATPAPTGGNGGGGGLSPLTASTPCSLNMTLNGTAVSYVSSALGPWTCIQGSSSSIAPPGEVSRLAWSAGVGSIDEGPNEFGLEFFYGSVETTTGGQLTDAQFFANFEEGVWPWGDPTAELGKVEIRLYEGAINYTSSCGSGSQSNAQVEVVDVLPITTQFFPGSLKARITFSCTLYACGTGLAPKTITNGTAVVVFGNN